MDLGEEPPAVVDLLTNDWRVTPDAIPATLLDLAARGFVDLDQLGPGRPRSNVSPPPRDARLANPSGGKRAPERVRRPARAEG